MQNKIGKLLALHDALDIYINMCKDIVRKEFNEDNVTYEEVKLMNKKSVRIISDITNQDYLRDINKYIIKISILDKTNIESFRKDNKLYLKLTK